MENEVSNLQPGLNFRCESCSQEAEISLHRGMLECSVCGTQISSWNNSDLDSNTSYLNPETAHHGAPSEFGRNQLGSTFSNSDKDSNGSQLSSSWKSSGKRLKRMDNQLKQHDLGSRQRRQAQELIMKNTPNGNLRTLSLDLLDTGWPDARKNKSIQPIWQAAHPWGIGGSAGACILQASRLLNIDCRIDELLSNVLPQTNPKFGRKAIFRASKSLSKIIRMNKELRYNHQDHPLAVMSRANLGETKFRIVSKDLHTIIQFVRQSEIHIGNARTFLACCTHMLATSREIEFKASEINTLFGCSVHYMLRSIPIYQLISNINPSLLKEEALPLP